jgi:hypothetical protein
MKTIERTLAELKRQRQILDTAIDGLGAVTALQPTPKRGYVETIAPEVPEVKATAEPETMRPKHRRKLSRKARLGISEAQKARHAKRRAAQAETEGQQPDAEVLTQMAPTIEPATMAGGAAGD